MNRKKILPVNYPLITTSTTIAGPLLILSNNDDYLSWFANNFFQIRSYYRDNVFCLRYDFERLWSVCPYFERSILYRDFVNVKWDNIISFVIDCIDLNNYIEIRTNQYYIPASQSYKKDHFFHDTLIYGYDKQKQTVNIADFYSNGIFTLTEMSFESLDNAYNLIKNCNDTYSANRIDIIKKIEVEYNFDLSKFKIELCDYLHSNNSTLSYEAKNKTVNSNQVFGIAVYNSLLDWLNHKTDGNKKNIDYRPFHFLYDHKISISKILLHIVNIGIIKESSIIEQWSEIEQKSLFLRNIYIKYAITLDIKLKNRMINLLLQLKESETRILQSLESICLMITD